METAAPVWTQGELLAKARRDARISTPRMALALGVTRKTINNYESGRTRPSLAVLKVWASLTKAEWILPEGGRDLAISDSPWNSENPNQGVLALAS